MLVSTQLETISVCEASSVPGHECVKGLRLQAQFAFVYAVPYAAARDVTSSSRPNTSTDGVW